MPWASYRRTPLGHHGFGRGLTHPGARWGGSAVDRWLRSFPPRRWDPCLTASRNMQQLPWQNGVESELDDLDG